VITTDRLQVLLGYVTVEIILASRRHRQREAVEASLLVNSALESSAIRSVESRESLASLELQAGAKLTKASAASCVHSSEQENNATRAGSSMNSNKNNEPMMIITDIA